MQFAGPSMNEQPHEPALAQLSDAQRMLVWAVRAWSAHHADLTSIWWSIDQAFTRQGLRFALPVFHDMMDALFSGLAVWPDIACVACPRLTRHEQRLLDLFAAHERSDEAGARRALQDWVLRSAARVVSQHAYQCVWIASAAGVRFDVDGRSDAARTATHLQ